MNHIVWKTNANVRSNCTHCTRICNSRYHLVRADRRLFSFMVQFELGVEILKIKQVALGVVGFVGMVF